MKDMIISKKARKKKTLLEDIADTTALVEVAQVSSLIDLAKGYNSAISNINLDIAKKLGLTSFKNY